MEGRLESLEKVVASIYTKLEDVDQMKAWIQEIRDSKVGSYEYT